jgi:hypothetical protein
MKQHDEVVGSDPNAIRVVAGPAGIVGQPEVTVGRGRRATQDETRVRHPMVDPAPVGALKQSLRRALVHHPHPEEGRVGVGHALPRPTGHGQRSLQQ